MSNALNKLVWWHFLLIALGASLILALILFFAKIKPTREMTDSTKADTATTEQAGGTQIAYNQKDKELKQAKLDTIEINNKWKVLSAVYMPNIEFGKDPLTSYESPQNNGVYTVGGRSYGIKDLPMVWSRWVTAWYQAQWRDGITAKTPFPIEAFPADPNEVSKLQFLAFPQKAPWTVDVQAKTFDQAMRHLRRFNLIQKHGMPVVDKVALSGQSPDLHVTYNMQMFIIPPTAPPPPDPTIDSGGAPAAGGGGSFGAGSPMSFGGASPMSSGGMRSPQSSGGMGAPQSSGGMGAPRGK